MAREDVDPEDGLGSGLRNWPCEREQEKLVSMHWWGVKGSKVSGLGER